MNGSRTARKRLRFILPFSLFLSLFIFSTSVLTNTVIGSNYLLGVGDVLEITVWGHPELKTTVQVRPDGYITFPLVGDQFADGKTASQLAEEIQQQLSAYVVAPSVTIIVVQFRTIRVQVLGEIHKPGYYRISAGDRLLDAIGLAGGPTNEANLSEVTVTRMSGGTADLFKVDVTSYIAEGNIAHNPPLHDGDVIYLPAAGNALVLGAVQRPGSHRVHQDMDILDLLAAGGGALSASDLSHAVLTRKIGDSSTEMIVDLNAIIQSGKGKIQVQADDVLFIPHKQLGVLFGEVKAPGSYAIEPEMTLAELIGAAGGLTDMGDPGQVRIVREIDGVRQSLTVDLSDTLTGKSGANPQVVGGDIIFVPEIMNTVLVLGEVRQPGAFTLKEQMGILDLIAKAGSTTANAALDRVTLTRQSGDEVLVQEINLAQLQGTGTGRDIELLPGDVIFVPEGAPQALVLGRIARPGSYRVSENMNLLDLLALAGGPLESAGDRVLITRSNETTEVNLGALTRLGIGNQKITAGDVIYVTEGRHQVLVLGEVRNPGYHRLEFGDRVLDGIAKAGGLLDSAAADLVSITRQTEDLTDVFAVNLELLEQNRFLDSNFLLEGGDVIIVPEAKRDVMVIGEVGKPGSYLLGKEQRLLDVIAQAGGMTDNAAVDAVQITRIGQDNSLHTAVYDLDAVIKGLSSDNPLVEPGDIVYVPETKTSVLVFGEVTAPGYYRATATTTLLDVIGQARGLTDQADAKSVSLTRIVDGETVIETIDLDLIMHTGEGDIRLTGGEMILIPKLDLEVTIIGEVRVPGRYRIRQGERLLEVLAKAGGLTDDADPWLTMTRWTDNEQEVLTINYRDLVQSNSPELNLTIVGGDIIYIPSMNRRILVFGEVARPGAYLVDQFTTLLDVIALAGGPTARAKLDEVMIASDSSGELVQYLDLNAIINQEQPNPLLLGGEVIHIPEARQILVMGEVARPGAFNLPAGGRVLDLLALAGGLRSSLMDQEVIVTRQGPEGDQVWIADYRSLLNSPNDHNLLLAGGDVVFVPEVSRQVVVLGEVARPGVYSVYEGARLLDAIAMAGGSTEKAELGSVGIYRGGDLTDPATFSMGQDRILFQGDASENPVIRGGDVIYVPKTTKPDWNTILGIMSGVRTFQQIIEWFIPDK